MIQNESVVKSDKDDIEDNISVIGLKIIEKEKEKLKDIYYNFDAITDNQTNRNLYKFITSYFIFILCYFF